MISKDNTRRKWHQHILGEMFGSFSFINVFSGKEVLDNGMQNMVEVAVATRIVQLLHKECASSKQKIDIAVLSPYPAQVQCMQTQLENNKYQNNDFFKVKVGVVDEYQGEKVDIVIISTVGANGDEVNRNLNNSSVLFSCTRHCLWILGDERVHMKGGSMWKSLIRDAKAQKCFIQADEHKDLAKVILEVKKDLHQLDELLSGETTLFRSTAWKVLFSRMFIKSFSKIESWETKKLVLLMLLKISSGWRPKRSYTATVVSECPYRDLIKEFKVKGMHLLCTIDIVKETQYTQVLKVWDILPFHEIPELVKRLEIIIGTYTREYIERCKTICSLRGSEFPMKWPLTSEIAQCKTHGNFPSDDMFMDSANGNGCVEKVKVRESLLLMKFYSLSATVVNNMISGCDGGELALPFELTEQEKDVVSFAKSSFILGRSGTGKTTVLTTKLFQNEQLHHLACEGFHEAMERNEEAKEDILRQLFVTFSPKLCYAVKQHVDGWKRLTCVGSSSTQNSSVRIDDIDKMMSEDSPDQFMHLPNDAYPLIITFNRFLLMLDGTVGISFFEKLPYARQLVCGNQTSNSRLVVWEEYMKYNVTYEIFRSSYWPHFNNKLTKNLDPSAIYTEIMSVIKGGFTEDNASDGILSRDDYVALCDGRISIFDSQKRELVYAIFLQYEKKKVQNGNFDLADLVNDLHQRLQVEGYKGDKMDYVFIDEVQDLSMRQIMLFKYVCPNVHEGFAFAGDTAQAIAKGIGFRFEDIRYLYFKKFLLASEKGKMSKMFQLSENFRTHAGVLNLAQSVINVLFHFFPLFVDALSPETSRISGELPVLFETENKNNAIKVIFEKGSDNSHEITGFGAEQVVIVRDEIHKEKVVNIVGKNALVLTIMESKGLEFQDVLLYDFFSAHPFSNEWRVIYEYMKENDILNPLCTAPCSSFEMEKHAVLCSELKQLYVAITRTRQRLWICETNGFSHPVYDFWKKLSLVEGKHLNHSFANEMQVPSSKNEWRSRGVKLFHENNFRMAQLCFLKAEDKSSERLAEAHLLRAIAVNARASYPERRKLFEDAAKLFNSIGKKELAAECFYEIEDYKTAGDLYLSESIWMKAGNCYYLAKCYKLAAEVYMKAGAFSKCLSACSEGKLFELGFELIGRWGDFGGAELEFFHKGALYYFSLKDFNSMMKFVHSFRSKDEIRNFLTKKRCFDELILLEKEWGNFEEVAKVTHEGALYYYSVKNFKIMMRYVCSFQTKDEMRNFLNRRRCYDELISLEKEWGNFEEAAEVTNKGAHYYYSVKNFESMMKYVCAFRNKNEMQSFLYDKRCFDELILLEEEWGNFEKAANLIQEAACYHFSVKNFKCMMKFVRSFSSKDEMRRFLHEKRCLDELILLEKEWGNFEEAAKVARLKPDPVLEADLLHKGALYYYSVKNFKIMMRYVCSFQTKDEMRNFLNRRRCYDELISLENEWGNFEKAAKLIQEAALYYFSVKNFKCMMKFVRSFSSKDEMRRFLHEKRCLDELILLEKEWGNFEEAAKVARLKPDPVLEADLLHMGGLHKESSLKILWHVFLNSTIFHSTDEPFKQKEKLLRKAVSIAKSDSDVFYQFVCNEAKILSEGKSEEELLKKGAEFLFCYKENAVAMGLERVKTVYEIENIENDVLHLMHSSFKSLDLLPEFLLLLETRGKFVQAAKISTENDHSREAALRRLWYVFFGSLWAHGSRAWPLKSFKQKDELLNDLNSYVTFNSDSLQH
ncbi:DNA helicase, UvrD/REP type, P-loop containing nucleoside triphosphate hydrolase [Artemisia annua]|uniref:DNA helicase, UvrD/REP type, P-loop containing nucleoside triphosphate hydrolase n=1 Tax=Artemisia annua TaxID=35608 RepID=A0A2U1MZR6_ARTAN|nr:DNA helicase, UvrD/REP type, P-loop containing nucleoside triphosphate hydrolase [Artemisia annua]